MGLKHSLIALAVLFHFQSLSYAEDTPANWPCVQRYVPELSAATIWLEAITDSEPVQSDTDETSKLINNLADRSIELDDALAQAEHYLTQKGSGDQGLVVNDLFAGVFAQIKAERKRIIKGIFRYTDRQRKLGRRIEEQRKILKSKQREELSANEQEDLQTRQSWDIRAFREREKQLNNLCEQPVKMEQRLFSVARFLQGHL